jgi:hypothetical protein
MFNKALILLAVFSFVICNIGYSRCLGNRILEYKNNINEFSIVIVKDHTNQKIAKQRAIIRAATLANKNGYKSFDIIKEEEVEVMLGKTNYPSTYDFPQNLYQEEIVEKGNYNRERIISGSKFDYKLRKAYKIQISCYKSSKGSYKVCDIIKC